MRGTTSARYHWIALSFLYQNMQLMAKYLFFLNFKKMKTKVLQKLALSKWLKMEKTACYISWIRKPNFTSNDQPIVQNDRRKLGYRFVNTTRPKTNNLAQGGCLQEKMVIGHWSLLKRSGQSCELCKKDPASDSETQGQGCRHRLDTSNAVGSYAIEPKNQSNDKVDFLSFFGIDRWSAISFYLFVGSIFMKRLFFGDEMEQIYDQIEQNQP